MDEIIPIGSATDAERDSFLAIYEEALPPSERKPRETILGLSAREDYRLLLMRGETGVSGFAIVFLGGDFALLEYLGVRAGERGRGSGARLFAAALAEAGARRLIVEVDSDREASADAALRTRRRGFYERLGARRIEGVDYRMPTVGEGMPPLMDLLIYPGGQPERGQVEQWIRAIYSGVYGIDIAERELQCMLA